MEHNTKTAISTILVIIVLGIIGFGLSRLFLRPTTFRITGRLEEVKSFQVGEDFKYLLKVRVDSSDDERFTPESITILNAHDSRIITLVDYSNKVCTSEGVNICSYPVTHKSEVTFVVMEVEGSNNLPELEGSIQ